MGVSSRVHIKWRHIKLNRILLRVGFGHLEVIGRGLEIEQMEASLLSLRGELDRIEYRP